MEDYRNLRESIKAVVENGISIEKSYKTGINEWYGKIELYKLNDVYRVGNLDLYDGDQAINYFIQEAFGPGNVGYTQERLREKGYINDDTDLENPSNELKELFKMETELIRDEFEKMDIIVNPFPTKDEAEKEMAEISQIEDPSIFGERCYHFKRKYSMLNVYLSISAEYTYTKDGNKSHTYYKNFDSLRVTKTDIDKAKKFKIKDCDTKFEKISLSCNIGGNTFTFYELFK